MKMKKIKIITAGSPDGLNGKIQEMIDEGWEPIGSHSVVNTHSQNRYRGTQHMDTLHQTEYSITMQMEVPEDVISIGVYSYDDEDGKKVYDIEEMRNEFETKLAEL